MITPFSTGARFLSLPYPLRATELTSATSSNIKGFMIQTGDPTGTGMGRRGGGVRSGADDDAAAGKGGQSIWGKPFADEVRSTLKVSEEL